MYNGPHKPLLEKVIHPFRYAAAQTVLAYENDEVDVESVDINDMDRIERHPVLSRELVKTPGRTTWYLFFKMADPPFNDIRVREAFARAVDRGRHLPGGPERRGGAGLFHDAAGLQGIQRRSHENLPGFRPATGEGVDEGGRLSKRAGFSKAGNVDSRTDAFHENGGRGHSKHVVGTPGNPRHHTDPRQISLHEQAVQLGNGFRFYSLRRRLRGSPQHARHDMALATEGRRAARLGEPRIRQAGGKGRARS